MSRGTGNLAGLMVLIPTTLIVLLLVSFLANSSAITNSTISNYSKSFSSGVIASADLGLFKDVSCSTPMTNISWGIMYPSSNKTVTMYVLNKGNVDIVLHVTTESWNPVSASQYISLTTGYAGATLKPSTSVMLSLTIMVSSLIHDISTFAFDIKVISTSV